MPTPCLLRAITAADADTICHHRESLFRETGRPEAAIATVREPFRAWLAPRLADGRYYGFLAMDGDAVVGGVGQMELDWPPHPAHPEDNRRGYVLNVFVEPAYRSRGVARALMAAAEKEFQRRGVGFLALHASVFGRPLYEATGWKANNEMVKMLGCATPAAR